MDLVGHPEPLSKVAGDLGGVLQSFSLEFLPVHGEVQNMLGTDVGRRTHCHVLLEPAKDIERVACISVEVEIAPRPYLITHDGGRHIPGPCGAASVHQQFRAEDGRFLRRREIEPVGDRHPQVAGASSVSFGHAKREVGSGGECAQDISRADHSCLLLSR